MSNDKFVLTVPRDKKYIPVVRVTVFSYSNTLGFGLDTIEDIKLSVSEACNNLVLHSESIEPFTVYLYEDDDDFCVDIVDVEGCFDFDSYKLPDLSKLNTGGFGIHIIEALTDKFFIENENDQQIMKLRFSLDRC